MPYTLDGFPKEQEELDPDTGEIVTTRYAGIDTNSIIWDAKNDLIFSCMVVAELDRQGFRRACCLWPRGRPYESGRDALLVFSDAKFHQAIDEQYRFQLYVMQEQGRFKPSANIVLNLKEE